MSSLLDGMWYFRCFLSVTNKIEVVLTKYNKIVGLQNSILTLIISPFFNKSKKKSKKKLKENIKPLFQLLEIASWAQQPNWCNLLLLTLWKHLTVFRAAEAGLVYFDKTRSPFCCEWTIPKATNVIVSKWWLDVKHPSKY